MELGIQDVMNLKGAITVNPGAFKNKRFSGVTIDSRKIKKNYLFFAVKGETFDGHDFVKDVLLKSACAVVTKKWYNKNKNNSSFKNKTLFAVSDTVKSLGELASVYRNKFVIPVLAVGGSNGKTTAKDFIAHVLASKYNVLKTEGNLNNQLGVPLTLFGLNRKHEIAVVETGTNHFNEVYSLCKIVQPQFGVITNIGKEHLEFLKNIQGAAKAEGELAEYLKEVYGTLFLNADDRFLRKYSGAKNINVFTYGQKGRVDVKGKVTDYTGFYPNIEIRINNKIIRTRLNTIGSQSFNAALLAAAIGSYFDLPVHLIKAALAGYKNASGKRNQLKSINGVNIIDDTYNSNPDSVLAALENLKQYKTSGKKYIVLGDMLELGKTSRKEHRDIGWAVKNMKFQNLLTFGKDSFNTHIGAKGVRNNYYFNSKETMAEFLAHVLRKNDIVLVKGSRTVKMEEVIEKLNKLISNLS